MVNYSRTIILLACFIAVCNAAQWFISPTGSVNGTGTASNPFPSLSVAVSSASTGDTIVLLPGTYVGPNNFITISKKLNIVSQQGKYATIMSCGGSSNSLQFSAQGIDLSGITFNNCDYGISTTVSCVISSCSFNGCTYGVQISQSNTVVQVINSVFQSNYYALSGGSSSSFTVFNSTISTSVSTAFELNGASLTLTSSKISGNSGNAAIYARGGSSLLIEATIFTNNYANSGSSTSGGAIYLDNSSATTSSCSFHNNTARNNGGAMFINNKSTLVDFGSKFDSNSATNSGGALMLSTSSIANLFGSSVTNNSATQGGDYACEGNSFLETQNVMNTGNRSEKPGNCKSSK